MCGYIAGRWNRGFVGYLVVTGALRRWSTVTELCKGTPGVASARPVITGCDIDVVVMCYCTLSGVTILWLFDVRRAFVIPYIWGLNRDERVLQLVV